MLPTSPYGGTQPVCSGWASIKRAGAHSDESWKRMWLSLDDDFRIFDIEHDLPIIIDIHAISVLKRVQHPEAPYCCLLGMNSEDEAEELYVSYWSNEELEEWIRVIQQLQGSGQGEDMEADGTNLLPEIDITDMFDHQSTSHIVDEPKPEEETNWRDNVLGSYYTDTPGPTPTSLTFPNTPLKLKRKPACKRKSKDQQFPSGDSRSGVPPQLQATTSTWVTYKHKLYQGLLSLLVLATSVENLQDDCFVDILRDLFQSIEALDSVSMFLSKPGCLREDTKNLDADEDSELVQLLRAISTSRTGYKAVLSLRGSRAQQFLDMAHEILHFPSLKRSQDKRFSIQVLKLMIRLSETCHQLPTSLFLEDVEVMEKDARFLGSFSNVYRARYGDQAVALKRMRIFESDTETVHMKLRQRFCREALLWQHLDHPNVLPFIGIDPDNFESLCMISPWLEGGTVLHHLKMNGIKEVDFILYGISQGLAYLHSLDVIHGDLRGVNILVDERGKPRIADFGLAVLADMSTSSSSYPGSARWTAPELLYPASQGLTKFRRSWASDVFSFAVKRDWSEAEIPSSSQDTIRQPVTKEDTKARRLKEIQDALNGVPRSTLSLKPPSTSTNGVKRPATAEVGPPGKKARQLPDSWSANQSDTMTSSTWGRTSSKGSITLSKSQQGSSRPPASKGKPQPIALSKEQKEILKLVEKGSSVFYTGSAGCGKSVLLREIIKVLRKKFSKSPDAVAITASTGIAACNIGGVTIHSFAGIGLGIEPANVLATKVRKNRKATARWQRTKVLIIDEVSMVDGDLFDKLCDIGSTVRSSPLPFGGIQVVLTGDFFQLPPVMKGGSAKFAFEARKWKDTIERTFNLTKVFHFVDMLNEMRFGTLSTKSINKFRNLSRPIKIDDGILATELFPRREDVERSNQSRMLTLPGTKDEVFDALDSGASDPEQRTKLLSNCMAPQRLVLRVGAQVMLIKNQEDGILVNGSIGKVVRFVDPNVYGTEDDVDGMPGGPTSVVGANAAAEALMKKKDKKSAGQPKLFPIVEFLLPNGYTRQTLIVPDVWKVELPSGEIQASRTQMPLILSWAMSIHKSQGQTLERVKVDLGKVFEAGQAYVALSRATSMEGLQILNFDPAKITLVSTPTTTSLGMAPVQTPGPLFLGLDLSTQQLKAILIAQDLSIIHESAVHFDRDLSKYGITNGAIKGPGEGEVTSPVAMWVEAMDLLMARMKEAGIDFSSIAAVSGAGQQHGSVYWSNEAESLLASLKPNETLLEQLSPAAFSIPRSPIWQDSSTTKQCLKLEESIGGPQALADLTGSRAYERFTGSQIAKIYEENPSGYEATKHISLVSSFIPSLFLGSIAPIEVSDASGMNLMNVLTCKWDARLLEICGGPTLSAKLGPEPVPGGTNLGTVHKWWVERWGFSPDCIVAPFTGDNPATVVSLSAPGDALLSLGTSTTFLLSIPPDDIPPKRFTTSHLLSHPTSPDAQIAMLCYKNGALAREQIRDRFADKDWTKFNTLVDSTPVGNNGLLGFYFPLPEIIPPGVLGEYFYKVDGAAASLADAIPEDAHPRAILESQFLSILSRVAAILPDHAPHLKRLVLTGGSSANPMIRQLSADLFGMKAYVSATKEAAGLGGAMLAKYAWWKKANGGKGTFEEMTGGEMPNMTCVAEPREEVSELYAKLVDAYRVAEDDVVKRCSK
ncbi:hypothetical protein ONZ45_g2042 [Pleurotus djamor]|nr:hypothetical protein ONZ45_g2042 [Pleurotus djamor]